VMTEFIAFLVIIFVIAFMSECAPIRGSSSRSSTQSHHV
jgi:hypothetical protein